MSDGNSSELITLKKYDKLPYARIGETGVRQLEKLTEDLGIPLFRFSHTEAQARQYVGVIRVGQRTIRILPKIYGRDEENLGYLVSCSGTRDGSVSGRPARSVTRSSRGPSSKSGYGISRSS